MTEKNDPDINLKDYCNNAARVLYSTEKLVKRNQEIWRETPEQDGELYNPEWTVSFSQEDVSLLIRNLHETGTFFEILGGNQDAAADLLKAHQEAEAGAN